ncbi:CubicO group peptidase, beta-lactamase class C family [Pedobacter steynii]|uniref:CubicO group peptidase, beta-lactamase class C family n=1 Tax=Pedobacter steynii TaxID=430522 RepID=A0A1G9NRT2_9SPHI|nr:serine hydrolase domain-containing protein [Pedobacter steynii]NQX39221.1 beta-lactamase family protein [Pedobacter steynii]SDL88695.1 CubicO group peptidase, beta-lactamase class C family [Pedobacter steynii]
MKRLTLLPLLLSPNFSYAQKNTRFDSLYLSLFKAGKLNGNVLIAEKGKIIYEKSFGFADFETGRKLNLNSVFELASVSKQFTAMGIVLLEKQGKLKYEDELGLYIPELSSYKGITIHHLLRHTSGLPDYMDLCEKNWDKSKIAVNQDVINLFQQLKPKADFAPNEKWEYSNTGYLLLATIIERVSKKSFADFLKENIFNPLKMKNSLVYRSRYQPQLIKNYAKGYVPDSLKGKILPDELGKAYYTHYLDGIVGDGMVNSTLEDLLKWDRALYTDQLINAEDKKKIFSSVKTDTGTDTHYGYGWVLEDNKIYGKIASHSGAWAGYITYIERHLDQDKTIIILQNYDEVSIPVKNTRNILYNRPIPARVAIDSNGLKAYSGKYKMGAAEDRTLSVKDGKLYVQLDPGDPDDISELIPIGNQLFMDSGLSYSAIYRFFTADKQLKFQVLEEEKGLDDLGIKIEGINP